MKKKVVGATVVIITKVGSYVGMSLVPIQVFFSVCRVRINR